MPVLSATLPARKHLGSIPALWCKTFMQYIGNEVCRDARRCSCRTLVMKEHAQTFSSIFFWRTEEHWKLGCMVSCRTVQGRERCAKREVEPASEWRICTENALSFSWRTEEDWKLGCMVSLQNCARPKKVCKKRSETSVGQSLLGSV